MCYQISGSLSIHLAATCVESAALGPSLIALRPVDLSELQGKTSCLEGLGPQVTDTWAPLDQLVFLMRLGPAMPCWKCSSESHCVQFSHSTSKSLPSITLGCCSRDAVQFCLLLYPHFSPTESQVGFYGWFGKPLHLGRLAHVSFWSLPPPSCVLSPDFLSAGKGTSSDG